MISASELGRNTVAGKEVKAGQALVVMSAMKMETSVAAPCDGVIRHVAVDLKDTVEAGNPPKRPNICHMPVQESIPSERYLLAVLSCWSNFNYIGCNQ